MSKNNKKGFTLIELLVVIAIIGILSSVVLASLNSARKKSRDARRIADVKQIQVALELFYDSNSTYPSSTAQLVTARFIPTLPKDPSTNGNYAYAALGTGGTCTSYHLGTDMEDPAHSALRSDSDAAAGTVCTGGGYTGSVGGVAYTGADFAGADTSTVGVYDVTP